MVGVRQLSRHIERLRQRDQHLLSCKEEAGLELPFEELRQESSLGLTDTRAGSAVQENCSRSGRKGCGCVTGLGKLAGHGIDPSAKMKRHSGVSAALRDMHNPALWMTARARI